MCGTLVWRGRLIPLAREHGVNVFIYDWYWYSGVQILHRPVEVVNLAP